MTVLQNRVFETLDLLEEPRLRPMGPLMALGESELCWTSEMLQFASDGSSVYIFDDPERVALQSWAAAIDRSLEVSRLYLRRRPSAWRIAHDGLVYRAAVVFFMGFVGLNITNGLLFFSPLAQVLPGREWLWLLGWTGEVAFATLVLKLALAALLLSGVSLLQRRVIALRFDAWRSKRSHGWQLCSSDLSKTHEILASAPGF